MESLRPSESRASDLMHDSDSSSSDCSPPGTMPSLAFLATVSTSFLLTDWKATWPSWREQSLSGHLEPSYIIHIRL